MACDWSKAPDDVLLKVFQFLPAKDLEVTEQVCGNWNDLCSRHDVWRKRCQRWSFWVRSQETTRAAWRGAAIRREAIDALVEQELYAMGNTLKPHPLSQAAIRTIGPESLDVLSERLLSPNMTEAQCARRAFDVVHDEALRHEVLLPRDRPLPEALTLFLVPTAQRFIGLCREEEH